MTTNEAELPSLVDLLAPGSGATHPALDLKSQSAQSYVKRLASLSLGDLKQEPASIRNERGVVESELVNLCYREYPTFTSVHRCSSAVGAAFDDFESSLSDLIESIPALEQECRGFAQGNSEMQATRRKTVLLLDHEDKLLDVLEIPLLMDTCVRNGYYQEALDLASHVSTLKSKANTAIMDDIATEVEGILQLMMAQLLSVLRAPVKLPNLLKAVNLLRRLQQVDEADLGLIFLTSRLHNYRARLVEIEGLRAEPVRYLRRYIDLFREHVFDIISQYTTIFQHPADDQLPSFTCLCVEDLVDLVRRYVPRIASDSAAMSSIVVQLGYCSLSFSRVGLDFSALLIEPFAKSISWSYEQAVTTAAELLVETLALGARNSTSPSSLLISIPHMQHILTDANSPPAHLDPNDVHTPANVFAQYPPLAQFVNAHLTALNALRLLAPYHLLPGLAEGQSRSIGKASEALLDYVEAAVTGEEAPSMTRSGSVTKHSRTNSSPRANLIRRNTETQLSHETLMAKRREAKRACVAAADTWLHMCTFLVRGLAHILEEHDLPINTEVDAVLDRLRVWTSDNAENEMDASTPGAMPIVAESQSAGAAVTPQESADRSDHLDSDTGRATYGGTVADQDDLVASSSPAHGPEIPLPDSLGASAAIGDTSRKADIAEVIADDDVPRLASPQPEALAPSNADSRDEAQDAVDSADDQFDAAATSTTAQELRAAENIAASTSSHKLDLDPGERLPTPTETPAVNASYSTSEIQSIDVPAVLDSQAPLRDATLSHGEPRPADDVDPDPPSLAAMNASESAMQPPSVAADVDDSTDTPHDAVNGDSTASSVADVTGSSTPVESRPLTPVDPPTPAESNTSNPEAPAAAKTASKKKKKKKGKK